MLELDIDRKSPTPLGEQIADSIAQKVKAGSLAGGTKLPSVRQLSQRLSVSPFTVMNAYDRLIAKGVLIPKPGAGYFVQTLRKDQAPAAHQKQTTSPVDVVGFALHALGGDSSLIQAGSGFLPADWLSDAVPTSGISKIAKSKELLSRTSAPQGHPGLRDQLAAKLQSQGVTAHPSCIVTTSGAAQALDLVLRSVAQPGDSILVEDPSYMFFSAQVRAMDLQLVPVPRLQDGPDLDALEDAVQKHHPKAFITQTLLHNPTGSTTSPSKCHRLLMLAERYGFLIIEDDVYGDIAAPGSTRIAQLDGLRRVAFLGSFSKLLSPSLRVGFAALPANLVDQVLGQKVLSVLSTPSFTEAIVASVLESGRFQRHTMQLRNKLATFHRGACEQLVESGIQLVNPEAEGVFLWGRLPGVDDVGPIVKSALAQGVLLAGGHMFSPYSAFTDHLRFNVAHSCDPRVAQVIRASLPHARISNVVSLTTR